MERDKRLQAIKKSIDMKPKFKKKSRETQDENKERIKQLQNKYMKQQEEEKKAQEEQSKKKMR